MSFFQNLFNFEFRPTMMGSDRQYQTGWHIKGNTNRSDYMVSSSVEPFNLLGNNVLTLNYAFDVNLMDYANLNVTLSGAVATAVTAKEVCDVLNADSVFSALFIASLYSSSKAPTSPNKVLIKSKRDRGNWRAYVSNGSAESIMKFNKNAVVAELPSYFEKYALSNRFTYQDLGPDRLLLLDPANPIDAAVITDAGFNPLTPKADWQLLAGSSDAYWFYKKTYVAGKVTEEIKYPAGAGVGFAAKKIFYGYDGSGNLIKVCETPYVLQSGDLVTP